MTPVEERIDHDTERLVAQALLMVEDAPEATLGHAAVMGVARAYLALLTEHSAREQALLKIMFMDDAPLAQYLARRALGLPAPESAQPPQNYQVDSIDAGADPPDAPQGEPPPGYVGPTGSGASE